jgi:hypothetical protein
MIRHGLPCMMVAITAFRPMEINAPTPPALSKLGHCQQDQRRFERNGLLTSTLFRPSQAGRQACFSHTNPHQNPFTHRPE